jgi:hypothetical protein
MHICKYYCHVNPYLSCHVMSCLYVYTSINLPFLIYTNDYVYWLPILFCFFIMVVHYLFLQYFAIFLLRR